MNRYLISFFLLVVPGPTARADETPTPVPSPSPAGTPSFPSQVELVVVDTVVTDKKGNAIAGLSKEDFVLSEDGQAQSIATFEAVQVPATASAAPAPRPRVSTNAGAEAHPGRSFIIVFDDVHLAPFQARRAKTAVGEFLKTGVREGDRVTLVSTGGDAWWSTRMEAGRDELITLLKRLEGRHIPDNSQEKMSDYEAMRIHVFGDPMVRDRVVRRFQTYGVTQGDSTGRTGADPMGDPIVQARAAEVYLQSVTRNRITLEVLERVLEGLTPTRGRKSLILVSEGFIWDPNLDEFKQVVQDSRRSNCAIYFLDTRGLSGLPEYFSAQFGPALDTQDLGAAFTDPMEASAGAETLSADSGGFSVKNTNDFTKGIQRIADESRAYYLLGYHPTNTKPDGRFRKIQVKVARKGLEVRARKGYYAPLEGGKATEKDKKKQQVDPQFQQALDSPYEVDGIPLRMTAYVFDETLLGKARVLVVTEADVRNFAFEEKDGRSVDSVDFLLVAAHRETGEYFRYDQKVDMKLLPETREKLIKNWFPIMRDFELAPGGYQAKIVVRDKQSGKIGTVVHEFEVPDLSQLRASTPVLSDTLQQGADTSSSPRPQIVARRTFTPGATLFCQYEVYGAQKDKATGMPKVSAGYVVRRNDGTVLTRVDATLINPTSLGRLSRLVGTSLENAAPGEYELVLSLKDELAGKPLELTEPFTVAGSPAPAGE